MTQPSRPSTLGRLFRAVRGKTPAGREINRLQSKNSAFRQALAGARAAIDTLKARDAENATRVGDLAARVELLEGKIEELREQKASQRREKLAPSVLRQILRVRRDWLTSRPLDPRATGREERLIAASDAYRSVVSSGVAALGPLVHRMELDGLTWWVPVNNRAVGMTQRWIDKQRFPYNGIVQTRELALGGVMLDVGANIGRMAIPRAVLGDVTAVFCAEPDPVTFACLVGNVVDNGLRGLILPDQTAIGDYEGTVGFDRTGSHSGHGVATGTRSVATNVVEVPCTTLDAWTARLGVDPIDVSFIKIDVEGYERRVLRGAASLLAQRHIVWQLEVNLPRLRAVGDDPQALYADLARSFTHFIDMSRQATGPRVRRVSELADALRYLEPDDKTDLLAYVGTDVA